MRLWIDDIIPAPKHFTLWAKSVDDAKLFIVMSEASMSGFAGISLLDVKADMAIELFSWLKDTNRLIVHKVHN